MNIADYLLTRLKELGITDVFGVPGDYNLSFLDRIERCKGLDWIGNCNELNAAYAADGYARVKGISALVTTFGVGELSALNGIAGSFAESVPVVHIVGSPALEVQEQHAIMHHTFGTGDFEIFLATNRTVSEMLVVLNSAETAAEQIDKALETCWIKKKPVYISLPSNMVDVEIVGKPSKPLTIDYPASDKPTVEELVKRAAKMIKQAKSPVILSDMCAVRHPMKPLIQTLLDNTGIPFATMNLGKGVINESHPQFIGLYAGDRSTKGVQERVESADCIISFGLMLSDFNTGEFSTHLDADVTLEIHSEHVRLKRALYPDVYFNAVLPALIDELKDYHHAERINHPHLDAYSPNGDALTQKRFWQAMGHFFEAGDTLIAETGTSMFGLNEVLLPDDVTVISQTLWGSIGYTVGALLGAALAERNKRTLLFVGDGSFQLTAQELSTVMRHKLNPIVFLLNNDGYTIERVIHGAKMEYNDIQPWSYCDVPKAFGDNVFTATVETEKDLSKTLSSLEKHKDKLRFIEVKLDRMDCPETLREIGRLCALRNK